MRLVTSYELEVPSSVDLIGSANRADTWSMYVLILLRCFSQNCSTASRKGMAFLCAPANGDSEVRGSAEDFLIVLVG